MTLWLGFAIAVWVCVRVFAGYAAPPRPLVALSRREWATLDAVAETLLPRGGAVTPSGMDASVALYLDRFVAASHFRQRVLMRALFLLVEHGTLLFPAAGLPGFRRFSSLDPSRREEVLRGWQTSGWFPRRLVFTSLRALCTMGYFANPTVQEQLQLVPMKIEGVHADADALYPRVGESRATLARSS